MLVLVLAALGVTGPTGSSSVPPPLPFWPFPEAARKESRSGMTAPSPASKKFVFVRLAVSIRYNLSHHLSFLVIATMPSTYTQTRWILIVISGHVVLVLLGIRHRLEAVVCVRSRRQLIDDQENRFMFFE
jgi:hypothetical protein